MAFKVLEFLGVGFVSRSDGVDTLANAKTSRFVYGIKGVMNEEFRRDLAEKTWRGLEGRVRAGYSAGGLPYGYRSEPVLDDRGQIVRVLGHRRVVYEPEAEVVRKIFRLYVGDEDGRPHLAREVAKILNRDGIAPPGARWQGRAKRQCTTWSYTAITAHRQLRKGILHNPIYTGTVLWNRSKWLRNPETRREAYRLRPMGDWIEVKDSTLRIVPQNLWDRAQAWLAAQRVAPTACERDGRRKYLLSGFVKCAVCGGNYTIATRHSYRCGTFRNRGEVACANHLTISRRRLERAVLEILRDRLCGEEHLAAFTNRVRALGRRVSGPSQNQAKALRGIEREIEHVKQAVRLGKATSTLLGMLEEAQRRRDELVAATGVPEDGDSARVAAALERLPDLVREVLSDLDTLLAVEDVDRAKAVLAGFQTTVTLHPVGGHLEAEVAGTLAGVLTLAAGRGGSTNRRFGGWGRRIRTPANGSRARRPTARRSPNGGEASSLY